MNFTRSLPIILALASTATPCLAQAPRAFEPNPVFSAATVFPPALLQGAHFRVRDHVLSARYIDYFEIDTDYGTFEAIGILQVATRIKEIEAIANLVAYKN